MPSVRPCSRSACRCDSATGLISGHTQLPCTTGIKPVYETQRSDTLNDIIVSCAVSNWVLPIWTYSNNLRARPHNGDGPLGPSLGPPPKHTLPPGLDLARPQGPALTSPLGPGPLGIGQRSQCVQKPRHKSPESRNVARSAVCLELTPVGVETLKE